MESSSPASARFFGEPSLRRERILLQFEQAWREGSKPAIESVLQGESMDRKALVSELVLIDLEYRFKSGEAPAIQSYLARFPELCESPHEVERLIAAERHWRRRLAIPQDLPEDAFRDSPDLIHDSMYDATDAAGQAHAAPKAPKNEPVPDGFRTAIEFGETVPCAQCGQETWVYSRLPGQQVACRACRQTLDWDQAATRSGPSSRLRQVGRYALLQQVGEGTFGNVYRARDLTLNRIVAVKVARSGQPPEQFLREAERAARLQHPLIVTVHDSGCEDTIPYIVCEFVEGQDLEKLQQTQPLDHDEAAELMAFVADAIHYAHDHGVIHRDLKPSNIMLEALPHEAASAGAMPQSDTSGKRRPRLKYRPRVMDFGLARRNDSDSTLSLFGPGCILGTAAYMSPEQARGESDHADRRSDVYSLGVILYRLLTGEVPFRGTMPMVIHKVIHEEPTPPRKLNDRIPRDLETIALKCLAKEPERRYQTAEQLAADLRRYLHDVPILARPAPLPERCWRWCRRNKPLAASAALGAGLIMAIVAMSLGYGIHQSRVAALLRQAQRDANRSLAEQMIDRAESLFQQGQASRGMLLLARAVELSDSDAPDLARVARINLAERQDTLHRLRAILQARAGIVAIAASHDGHVVAAGLPDGAILRWELASGASLATTIRHPGGVQQVLFTKNRERLITAGGDTICMWNTSTGKLHVPPMRHYGLRAIAYDPRHERILSVGQRALLWGADSGKQLARVSDEEEITAGCFDSRGGHVWTASSSGMIQQWSLIEAAGGLQVVAQQYIEQQRSIAVLVAELDGRHLWTGSFDGVGSRWHIASRERVREFSPGHGVVTGIDPAAQTMATRGSDGLARLWNLHSLELLGQPLQHPQEVATVCFAAGKSRKLLTGGAEGTVRVWQQPIADGARVLPHDAVVMAAGFCEEGRQIVTAALDGVVRRCEADADQPIEPLIQLQQPVLVMRLHSAGRRLLTLLQTKQLQAFDLATGRPVGPPIDCPDGVVDVIFMDRDDRAVTIDTSQHARMWNLEQGSAIGPVLPHATTILSVALAADGRELLTGCIDGSCRRFNVVTGHEILPALSTQGPLRTLLPCQDSSLLVGSDRGRRLTIWDQRQASPQGRLLMEAGEVHAICFSPDERWLVAAGDSQQARFWDPRKGELWGQPIDHGAAIRAIAFDPTGSILVTAGDDGRIRYWDVPTRKPLGQSRQFPVSVDMIAVSSGGLLLVAGGSEVRTYPLPRPLSQETEQIQRFVVALTGQRLDANGVIQAVDATQWTRAR